MRKSNAIVAALTLLLMAPVQAQSPPAPAEAELAPVALLVDLSSGQTLYARGASQRFLPASMTKAMTALVAFDLIAAGQLDEARVITISAPVAAGWAGQGTTLNLRAGQAVSIGDLLMGTTTVSANDAAVALAEAAGGSTEHFVALMNARAAALGMADSHFAGPNGYPDGGRTYVSAADLARLAAALVRDHPALYRRYFGHPAMAWRGAVLRSHDPFAAAGFPGADGIKTGHTAEAGYNFLGAVIRAGRRLVLVIGGAASEGSRAAAARALAEWGYGAWDSRALAPAGWIAGTARVQDGTRREVPLALAQEARIALARGSLAPGTSPVMSARIVYRGPLIAPVAKGAAVARLEITVRGGPPASLPLVAAAGADKAGPIDRIVNGLLGLLG